MEHSLEEIVHGEEQLQQAILHLTLSSLRCIIDLLSL